MTKSIKNSLRIYPKNIRKRPAEIFSQTILIENNQHNSTNFDLVAKYLDKLTFTGIQFIEGFKQIEKKILKINFCELERNLGKIKDLDVQLPALLVNKKNKKYTNPEILKCFIYDIFLYYSKIRGSLLEKFVKPELGDAGLNKKQLSEYQMFILSAPVAELIVRIEKDKVLKNKISTPDLNFLKFTNCFVKEPNLNEIFQWFLFLSLYTNDQLKELNLIRTKLRNEGFKMQNGQNIEALPYSKIEDEITTVFYHFVYTKDYIKLYLPIFNPIIETLEESRILKKENIIISFQNRQSSEI